MRLCKLSLRGFRNLEEQIIEFAPGVNWLIGANGQGKTNVIEALYLLVTGRSFRSAQLKPLIQMGAEYFFVELEFENRKREERLSYGTDGKIRRIRHGEQVLPSSSELLGLLPATLLAPHDQLLVKGGPSYRRKYLDLLLSQSDRTYVQQLIRYTKALKQRNALLRRGDLRGIEVFEEQLAASGQYLIEQRGVLVGQLNERLSRVWGELTGKEELLQAELVEEGIDVHRFAQMRPKELLRKVTLVGPHRSDLVLRLGGVDARVYGSEGQQRSVASVMRFVEWELLSERTGRMAACFVDDAGLSLDEQKRERLIESLQGKGSVVISSPERFGSGPVHELTVSGGQVRRGGG